ncbi:MAG: hypothetical protein NC818_06695 [Candidatus Omnitrophica bacterium]|nr:hypothetical protein [Candidatus Omnitrophota bacterium]
MKIMEELKNLLAEEIPPEMDFPQVFVQPKLEVCCRGKNNILQLLRKIKKSREKKDGASFTDAYNKLLVEFRPFLKWASSCWDYLLTTEGIRYVSRPETEKAYCHGDYRAFTDKDFHHLIHKVFKACAITYAEKNDGKSFIFYLKKNFWENILEEYKRLENPQDPRQRKLTLYSYLRCVPYEFLNHYHQEIVDNTLMKLEKEEKEIIESYFLNFLKEEEIVKIRKISIEDFYRFKEEVLYKISLLNPLVSALLMQIERY